MAIGKTDDLDVTEVEGTHMSRVSQEGADGASVREVTPTFGGTYKVHPHLTLTITELERHPTHSGRSSGSMGMIAP